MADRRRGESKQLKKDETVRRETLEEIGSEIVQERTEAGRTDEDRSRDAEKDGDEGFSPQSNR
jgi:8-oxo-dGTP pyrophosphatase MutT (NUDIX family)